MIACAKEVFYTPGNHDSFMHALDDQTVGALQVAESFVHTTAEGKNFLVLHGDQFDKSCREGWPIAYAGAWAYEFLTRLNRALNRGRQKRGAEPFTFAADAKHAVKKAVKDASTYEAQLLALARTRGCEGVVCGHVHRPEIKAVGAQLYVNSGDWVENNSFVVEYENGRMQLEHLQVPRRP
jgi:UDP-2,3-diacylglucosamine pyrophosphatase LpxH